MNKANDGTTMKSEQELKYRVNSPFNTDMVWVFVADVLDLINLIHKNSKSSK